MKFSLAEKERSRQEQKVNGLTKALEGAKENHKAVCQELAKVKAERETECVLCGLKSMMCVYYYIDMPLVYYVI